MEDLEKEMEIITKCFEKYDYKRTLKDLKRKVIIFKKTKGRIQILIVLQKKQKNYTSSYSIWNQDSIRSDEEMLNVTIIYLEGKRDLEKIKNEMPNIL